VLVLLRVVDASPESVGLVEDWYAQSSLLEKRAVLRALALLPYPKRYAALATLGTLARDGVLFDAICYDNPYPSQYLDDKVFNNMVEASLVMGRPMDRIMGLKDRMNPTIMRLFAEYGRPPSGEVAP
jgi:hypothetical protein